MGEPKRGKIYDYENVTLVRVIDGDTVELDIDQGNHQHWVDKFRLAGIDAAESRGKTKTAGDAATAFLRKLLADNITTVRTHKPDKYGRWLVQIWTDRAESVNQRMLTEGHAVPYDGGAKS